jgi:hypothetical protein
MNRPAFQRRMQELTRSSSWALIAAFGTYFCTYGYRKPFTAAIYQSDSVWGMDYKSLLVIFQTFGYAVSKWAGIKVVSEIRPSQRIKVLLGLIAFAETMLFCFGLVPKPWNIICLFLNGLPLGVVFGLILGFLEGRRRSEALIAGLCASFIVSDGFSKSVGAQLLQMGISEKWMPFLAGLVFLLPLLLFISMLSRVPPPDRADVDARAGRSPIDAHGRKSLFLKFGPGLFAIIIAHLLVTLLRSLRADFAPEIWESLGYPKTPAVFTQSELWVSFGVVIINGMAIFILDHKKAFRISLITCLSGFILIMLSVWFQKWGIGNFSFMVLVGLGLYLPYVAVHTTIFERLIAITRDRANIGFFMYLVDSVGYTGYVVLLLCRNLMPEKTSLMVLFTRACLAAGLVGTGAILFCLVYFSKRHKKYAPQLGTWSPG